MTDSVTTSATSDTNTTLGNGYVYAMFRVVLYPNEILRKQVKPVTRFDASLKKLASIMIHTMYTHAGIGLAANQVNFDGRIFVCDVSDTCDKPMVFVNPEIIEASGECGVEEGCLSTPEQRNYVTLSLIHI